MEANKNKSNEQVNPGDMDRFGNEAVIKKNEGLGEQGNKWSDEEPIANEGSAVLGEKAEKYMRESGDIEDMPEQVDEDELHTLLDESDKNDEDDVKERKEDYVPGFDLGRNKVQ
jgi:hypothetical protein